MGHLKNMLEKQNELEALINQRKLCFEEINKFKASLDEDSLNEKLAHSIREELNNENYNFMFLYGYDDLKEIVSFSGIFRASEERLDPVLQIFLQFGTGNQRKDKSIALPMQDEFLNRIYLVDGFGGKTLEQRVKDLFDAILKLKHQVELDTISSELRNQELAVEEIDSKIVQLKLEILSLSSKPSVCDVDLARISAEIDGKRQQRRITDYFQPEKRKDKSGTEGDETKAAQP